MAGRSRLRIFLKHMSPRIKKFQITAFAKEISFSFQAYCLRRYDYLFELY
jgi:hypothetical protein